MIIQSKRIWIAGQFMKAQLRIEEGIIQSVYNYGEKRPDRDFGTLRVVPGFLDIHTHGAYGYDTNDGESSGLRDWVRRIPEEGVTALLPTTITQKTEILNQALHHVATVMKEGYQGAEILGIHLEGPFLNMKYKGAQPQEAIEPPSVTRFKDYQKAAEGTIKYITLAPELDKGYSLTRYCKENGVVVSMGHSSATYEQALFAVANGVTSMTHVYNGMSPYHHRQPGLVGTALRVKELYGEIICDGCHSHVAALNNYYMAKGRSHAIMVSDSLRAKNCPPGEDYELGGHAIEIREDGLAYLKGTQTIAGSTLKINDGLRILVEEAMVPFDFALNSCTINPARCLGIGDRKGQLTAGYDADLVVLGDRYEVIETYCKGKKCWENER
ncbi:N-acetylglucosamine-6-phosphate deacetylase [Clostridium sp. E02]|uniref:N-acetylglucosamine-6-phosphate deacetylase n=1 Tax=Clostridium sp. E02 TaxID=2487134 RepID=UPI000F529B95|nr:N-acetylglucosamine-6-phosphate deacetylase [Clostridium sp. E02]